MKYRQWASWQEVGSSDPDSVWPKDLRLNVFKSQLPGTIKIQVLAHETRDRIYPIIGHNPGPPWTDEIEFWAYRIRRPGTEAFSIVYRDESTGYRFVKAGNEDGWDVVFNIWLPV